MIIIIIATIGIINGHNTNNNHYIFNFYYIEITQNETLYFRQTI